MNITPLSVWSEVILISKILFFFVNKYSLNYQGIGNETP